MKRTLLTVIISALMATSAVFGQHTQSISFTGPTVWTPGMAVTVDDFLTFSGYNAYGLSYWLEVQSAVAPFIAITDIQFIEFPRPQPPPFPILFTNCGGNGYCGETAELGGSHDPIDVIPPGTYHLSTITFSLAAGAPSGSYTLRTTSQLPFTSEVTDTDFNDNNIPPGTFVFQVVPEPSTVALLGFVAVGCGVLIYRRRDH